MDTRRWMLVASFVAGSMAAGCLPAAADPPPAYLPPPPICCGGLLDALFGYHPAYPYYYAGPLSGATYEYYYGSYWHRPYWRRLRHHHLVK